MIYKSINVDKIIIEVIRSIFKGLEPVPKISLVDWSNEKRKLSPEGSKEPGSYKVERFPYVKEILEALSVYSGIKKVTLAAPTQFGKTEIGNNVVMYHIDLNPLPILFVLPTETVGRSHSKDKFQTSCSIMPCMNGKIKEVKSRDPDNTITYKKFPGGSLTFSWSGSVSGKISKSIGLVVLSDIDSFGDNVEGNDEIMLYQKRLDSWGDSGKLFLESQVGKKGKKDSLSNSSRILEEWEKGSQGIYHVPCSHCGEFVFLDFLWEEIKDLKDGETLKNGICFTVDDNDAVKDVWFVCPKCGKTMYEGEKNTFLKAGEYIHKYPERIYTEAGISFTANGFYSPSGLVSWGKIIHEFIDAWKESKKGNYKPLQVWVNVRMVKLLRKGIKKIEWESIKMLAEEYKLFQIPRVDIRIITHGIDFHENHIDIVSMGWGMGFESWIIGYHVIYTSDIEGSAWHRELEDYLKNSFPCGFEIRKGAQMDTGYRPQLVYSFCRTRFPEVIATLGASRMGKPIFGQSSLQDVDWHGVKIKEGIRVFLVGTDTAKFEIMTWLEKSVEKKEKRN